MKKRLDPRLSLNRVATDADDGRDGIFVLMGPLGRRLNIIATRGAGWDHVSISLAGLPSETPTWEEMNWVKDLCFDAEECVVQYHPPKSRYVNCHPGTLHLWRPQNQTIPQPPPILVGGGAYA